MRTLSMPIATARLLLGGTGRPGEGSAAARTHCFSRAAFVHGVQARGSALMVSFN